MDERTKTRAQLIDELNKQRRAAEREAAIAGRRQTEEAPCRGEDQLQILVDNLRDVAYSYHVGRMTRVFTEANSTITGYLAERPDGNPQHWREVVHPNDVEAVERLLAARPEDSPTVEATFRIQSREGDWRWMQSRLVAAKSTLGGSVGYHRIDRDVTEYKSARAEIRQQRLQLETMRQMGLETATMVDLNSLLSSICTRAIDLLEADGGGIYLHRPERGVLEWAVSVGREGAPLGTLLNWGEGLAGRVWETGDPFAVADYHEWEGRAAVWEPYGGPAVVGVPIRCQNSGNGEDFLGVLDVARSVQRPFSQDDVQLIGMFATYAAIAIRNANLWEEAREQWKLAESLEQASAAISSTLHPDEVLDLILEQVERVVPGDTFNILLTEDGTVRIVRWRSAAHHVTSRPDLDVSLPIDRYPSLMKMRDGGESIVIPDTAADPRWISSGGEEWRRSYVGAPIQVGGVTVGFLNAASSQPGKFSSSDARRLEIFANHAATAIENAQLYRELGTYAEQLGQRVLDRTAQLEAQYARLDAIVRGTADGIFVTNRKGEIIQTNPVAHNWLTQKLSPDNADRLRRAARDLTWLAEERPDEVVELTGLDMELMASPISVPGTEEAGAVIAVHDVSELKELDRMKTRFVSNVSHELRTPVTTIKLYAALMRRKPARWQQYLDALIEEADRQVQLVEEILQLSRIDVGRLEMKPQLTPLTDLTRAVVSNHQVLAQDSELILSHSTSAQESVVQVDRDQMMQVLTNLVVNAIRYTPSGGEVRVSVDNREADGRTWAAATVEDTGIGITEDELTHAFDRFFRGERPQALQITGTGLGLAIVKEIVELHGGRVTVESAVDVGSAFTVWLPLAS